MIVVGIDPASAVLGYAVIRENGGKLALLDAGVITAPRGWPTWKRLRTIGEDLEVVTAETLDRRLPGEPVAAGIEAGFVKGQMGALASGAARGVATFVVTRDLNCEMVEYAPATVKKRIVGHGHAEKEQVANMVKRLLGMKTTPEHDAADAIAVAICRARDVPAEALRAAGR